MVLVWGRSCVGTRVLCGRVPHRASHRHLDPAGLSGAFNPGSWVAFSRVPCTKCSKEPLLQRPTELSFLPSLKLGQAVGCEQGSDGEPLPGDRPGGTERGELVRGAPRKGSEDEEVTDGV